MSHRTAAALCALLLLTARAWSAPVEPELAPMTTPRRPRAAPAPPPPPAAEPPPAEAAPKPEPLPERDEDRERLRKEPRRPWTTFRTRAWLAKSLVEVRYSIQIPREQIDPPAEVFYGETQEFGASGVMMLHSAELAPLTWFSVEMEYGEDRPKAGGYTDRYWLHSPHSDSLTNLSNGAVWHRPDHEDDLIYHAINVSRRDWTQANMYLRVWEGRVGGAGETEISHALDLALGAHRFRQDSRQTGLERTFSAGKFYAPLPVGPLPGYDSTYSAVFEGAHFGFREEMVFPLGFTCDGQFLWSPVAKFRGDGYDNFSAGPGGLRSVSPNYTDRTNGTALNFRLGAAWTWTVLRIDAGYMRLSFRGRRGNRRYYLDDGTTFDQGLDMNDVEVAGFYAGASLRF